jgi:excisionase family DNA binding protein
MIVKLEKEDIKEIAFEIMAMIKPLLPDVNVSHGAHDLIFDKQGLADYLKVSISTVNKMVSNKQIPHFKIQSGQSGGVRFNKKDIDKWIKKQTIPEIVPFIGKITA